MLLVDRYEEAELLGEGMSSKVYKAFDRQTKSWVALKHISPHVANDPIGIKRFYREVQITRSIHHPRVIDIFDLHESPSGVFLSMELLVGHDLASYLNLHGPLPPEVVKEFVFQILDVLKSCHLANVIHRDIKPQNIFVLSDGSLKLLDFGISRMASLTDLTQTGTSLGSPEYMAPELFSSSCYDPRTDLYSVGVVAYELLTGRRPFDGETLAILFRQHAEAAPPAIHMSRQDVWPWFEKLIFKLISKKPMDRYQSAREALLDLDAESVVSETLPKLDRLECPQCFHATIASLPICIQCGYETDAQNSKDNCHSLWVAPTAEREKLQTYLTKTYLDIDSTNLPKNRAFKLIGGLSGDSAALTKKHAQRFSVPTEVRADSIRGFMNSHPVLIIIGLALLGFVSQFVVPAIHHNWNELRTNYKTLWGPEPSLFVDYFSLLPQAIAAWPLMPSELSQATDLYFSLGTAAIFWLIALRWFTSTIQAFAPALVTQQQIKNASLTANPILLSAIRSGVNAAAGKSDSLRETDLAILDRSLLILGEMTLDSHLLRVTTESVLQSGLKMTSLMAQLQHQMFVTPKPSATQLSELEDQYSVLNNKLVFMLSYLNTIAAKLITQKSVSLEAEIGQLQSAFSETDAVLGSHSDVLPTVERAA